MRIFSFLQKIVTPKRWASTYLPPSLNHYNDENFITNPSFEEKHNPPKGLTEPASKVLTLRMTRADGRENGAARLIFPGLNITPFINGEIGFLGIVSSSSPVNIQNLYSKSPDDPSEAEINYLATNPAVPAAIFAACETAPSNSEITGNGDFGLFFINYQKYKEAITKVGKENKKCYTTLPQDINHHLYEINPKNFKLTIAKLSPEIIAFGQHKSQQDLDKQSKILEQKKEKFINEKSKNLSNESAQKIMKSLEEGDASVSELWRILYSEILSKTNHLKIDNHNSPKTESANPKSEKPSNTIKTIEEGISKINPSDREWQNSGGDL